MNLDTVVSAENLVWFPAPQDAWNHELCVIPLNPESARLQPQTTRQQQSEELAQTCELKVRPRMPTLSRLWDCIQQMRF